MKRGAFLALAAAAPVAAHASSLVERSGALQLGDDVFVAESWRELRGKRIGIVTNPSGVLSDGRSVVDAVAGLKQLHVSALFGPEHGIRGVAGAGEHVDSSVDERTGLPVRSLYGATRRPTPQMLADVDVLLFDIQDVGARPYTYVSTMAYVMQAAARDGKSVWVLDRPNPIGGVHVEGPLTKPAFASFVGLYPIPERHGMTVGELARLFNDRFGIGCDLHVVPMRGWQREMVWEETGLTWVPTSPNMPTARTTLVYLATGLVDEAGVNNGVGTPNPFEYAGAFGLDPKRYAATLQARNVPGVRFEPAIWVPARGFWAGKELAGTRLIVEDAHAFPSVRTAVELMVALRDVTGRVPIHDAKVMDRDWGTDRVRLQLIDGASADAIVASWASDERAFKALRAKYLLYPARA